MSRELLQQALVHLENACMPAPVPAQCDGGTCGAGGYCDNCPKQAAAPVPDPWRMAVDAAMVGHALDCTTPDSDPKQCVDLLCKQVADIWRDIAAPVPVPLTNQKRGDLVMEHLGPLALTGGKLSIYDAFLLGIDAAQQAHGIAASPEKKP